MRSSFNGRPQAAAGDDKAILHPSASSGVMKHRQAVYGLYTSMVFVDANSFGML